MPPIFIKIAGFLSFLAFLIPVSASDLDDDVQFKVDSIQQLIASEEVDTIKLNHYLALTKYLHTKDRTAVIPIQAEYLALAEKVGDLDQVASVHQLISGNYLNLGSDDLAHPHIQKALDHYKETGNLQRVAANLNNLALYYYRSNRYEDAIETYQEVITYSDSISDHAGKVYALVNMMAFSKDQKDESKALEYVEHIEDIVDRFDDIPEDQVTEIKSFFAPIYLNAGLCSKDLAVRDTNYMLFDTAYAYFDKALDGLEFVSSDFAKKYYRGYILNGRGENLFEEAKTLESNSEVSAGLLTDMHEESYANYKESYSLFDEIGVKREQAFSLVNQGKSLNKLKNYTKAFTLLEQGLNRALELKFTEQIRDAYEQLKINSEKIGDYKSAYAYSEEWIKYKDQILNEDRINVTKRLETELKVGQIENDLREEQYQSALQQQRADQQARQRMFVYAFTMLFGLGIAYMFFTRMRLRKQKEVAAYQIEMNKAMAKFVPMPFINAIGSDKITDVKLGDQIEKEVTVVFTDIRNFTSISENLTPADNFAFVQEYAARMGPIIESRGGFISQYLGDGIMAIFQDNPTQALRACVEMQADIDEYNQELIGLGRRPITVGMGMHTGPLVMGIIGDDERWDATLISDAVNTAARIEQTTKVMKASILMSEYSARQMQEINGQMLVHKGQAKIKGKLEPIEIYECKKIEDSVPEELAEVLSST